MAGRKRWQPPARSTNPPCGSSPTKRGCWELEREGYQKGVRAVMQEKSLASLDIHGPLSKLIAVEQAYALAIETALGNALQNIVTGTEEDAKAAIAFLKKNRLGRVTFLPVSSVRGRKFEYRLEGEPATSASAPILFRLTDNIEISCPAC